MMSKAMLISGAILVLTAVAPAANAVMIVGEATFLVEYSGPDREFDPPLLGPGSWMIESLPFNPNDSEPDSTFNVLDFAFSFAGHSWDASDVNVCECYFTSEGDPLIVNFNFDDGTVSWLLSWSFIDGNFGFDFYDGVVFADATSENGGVSGGGDFSFFLVPTIPEPGTIALLSLGLLGLGVTRRKAN